MRTEGRLFVASARRTAALIACMATMPLLPAQAAEKKLQGDPRAVEAIERMLAHLGGAQAWANARSLYLEYRVWRTEPDEHLIERVWRDLREPGQRIELVSPSAPVTWTFTQQSGWVSRPAGVTPLSEKRHAEAVEGWPYDFYTIIRAFAVADGSFSLEFAAPRRVAVRSAAGADWGWWEIDSNGAPLKWGSTVGDDTVEYVYGPAKDFGDIRFPAWGAAVDGSWRFEYAAVRLSPDAIPTRLLAKPE